MKIKTKNKSSNIHLQRAFAKYGLEQFSFNVLEFCSNDLNLSKKRIFISLNRIRTKVFKLN